MTRKLAALALALILAPALLGLQECNAFNETDSPTGPRAACTAPTTVSAVVAPRSCTAGAQAITCTADYNAVVAEGDQITWDFVGGSPPDSASASGAVSWTTQSLPLTVSWRATRCTCDAQRDPDRESCRTQDGSTTFTAQG